MQRNKIILVGLMLVAVVGIFFGIFLQNQQEKQTAQGPVVPSIIVDPPPRIITVPKIPKEASFIYTGPIKTVPLTVSTYQFVESTSTNALYSLANDASTRFSVTAKPSAIVDGDYFAYTKSETNRSFSLSKTKNVVSITYQRLLIEDPSLVITNNAQSASLFFSSLLSLPQGETLVPMISNETVFDGVLVLERPTPKLFNYVFGITIEGIHLLTRENTKRWASLIVDERGAIRVLNYIAPPVVSRGPDTQIIPFDQAIANINYGRGDLLWITQASGDEYGVIPSFISGNLTDFSLVYVFQGASLVPAYLFEGNGTAKTGEQQVFEVLVLAYPSTQ
jgi:hypothetical protein